MDKINIKSNKNITFDGNNKPLDEYKNLKSTYKDIVNKLDCSDFKNSQTRYMTELNFIVELKQMAQDRKLEDEYAHWCKKEKEIRKILLDKFHLKIDE